MLCKNCNQPVEPDDGGANQRVVFYTNESFFEPESEMFVVAQIHEDEAGYGVWARHATLEEAQAAVRANNGLLGVSDDDILEVVMSSMRLGNRR